MKNRNWMKLAVAVLLAPVLTLGGCSSGSKTDGDSKKADTPATTLAEPVTIIESIKGNAPSLKTLGTMLIKTQAEFDALGEKDIFPGKLDFAKNDLVIIALGERMTGGYSVEINSIQLEGDKLFVNGKATAPGPDAITTQALTYPYAAVVIENTTATMAVPAVD